MQIDVRWRPCGGNDKNASDKSFSGKFDVVHANVLAHIERLYLNRTTLKHPDRAEATKFWNFSLPEISTALQLAVERAVAQDAHHLWVDISHHCIDIRLAGSVQSKALALLDADDSLFSVRAHPLYRAPNEEVKAGIAA